MISDIEDVCFFGCGLSASYCVRFSPDGPVLRIGQWMDQFGAHSHDYDFDKR